MSSSFFDQHPLTKMHPHPIYHHPLVGGYNPLYYQSLTYMEATTFYRHLPALAPPFLPDLIIEFNENNQADSDISINFYWTS